MGFLYLLVSVAALFLTTVSSTSLATFSPIDGIKYSVGVPSSTTTAGSGDIYFQILGPSSYQWIAIGIGTTMADSTIFVVYADGTGNVTVSPRKGANHVMPQFNPDAQVTLLAGSGVANGLITANVKYSAAAGLLSLSSATSNWVGSYKLGPPLNSKSQSQTITQHDDTAQYTLDLADAQLTGDSNPFVSSGTGNSSQTGTGSGPAESGTSSGNSGSSVAIVNPITIYEKSHGTIMSVVMVILFPLGALVMRVFGGVWIHAAIQMFGLIAMIVGFGLGIHLAQISDLLYNTTHTIFGTVIVCLFFVQPILGLLHHRQYLKLGRRSYFGYGHIWYGRILIICGVINGGLGLQLAANTSNGNVAYGVVAGVMFVLYVVVVVVTGLRKRKTKQEVPSS